MRAQQLASGDNLSAYRWSSYGEYLKPAGQRRPWLRVDRLLGAWHIPKDSAAGREPFAQPMEIRRATEENASELRRIRRGWCFGSPEFRQELFEPRDRRFGRHPGGPERQESEAAQAERVLGGEMRRRHWRAEDLIRRRKGDREKAKLAWRLRQETTMTWDWMAEKLAMGSAGYAANCVREIREQSR